MSEALVYQSFPLNAGQDVDFPFTITDKQGAAVDLTGATARFVLSRTRSSTPILDSSASPATATITFTDRPNGLLTVSLTDANTDSLVGDYYYQLKIVDASGNEGVAAQGWITFEPSPTAG